MITLQNNDKHPEHNRANSKRRRGVVSSVGDIASDVTSLAELQFQLLSVDVADSKKHLALPVMLIGGGVALSLAAAVGLVLSIAACLFEFANLSISASLGIATLIGITGAMGAMLMAFAGFRKAMTYFERSRSELKQNIEWLKQLKNRNRSGSDFLN